MNTNWSSPKTNFLAGMNELRKCLASGHNAVLVRELNENCAYPIRVKNHNLDFRCYEFYSGHPSSVAEIQAMKNLSDFEKDLSINYSAVFGTPEAIETYYNTGQLSADNFRGMGKSHIVKNSDAIKYFTETNQLDRVQYFTDERYFFDFFRLKSGNDAWLIKKFKSKLWVVVMLDKSKRKVPVPFLIKIMNAVLYPIKFIPTRSILQMPEYRLVTYRIGGIIHGYSIEFQIPKKFSFK
jgi:hypothetical protein